MSDFLKLFFNEGETFCVSPNKYAYHSVGFDSFLKNEVELVSPNPDFLSVKAPFSEMAQMAVNPIKGFREDQNCTAFRSFLVEIDKGTMQEQMQYIKGLRMPYSVCTFSGNKSLHFGIVLKEDIGSVETYRLLAKWILAIASEADQQTGPPSRCIRMPGVKRGDNMQALVELKGRVSLDDLYSWLGKHKHLRPQIAKKKEREELVPTGKLPYWLIRALEDVNAHAAKNGNGRNQTWFMIFIELAKLGKPLNDMIALAQPHFEEERDFKEREWLKIAESAEKQFKERLK